MVRSAVRIAGRIELPAGSDAARALADPRFRQLALLDFQVMAAKAFVLPIAQVRVHQQLWLGPALGRPEPEQRWHRDACSEKGHVLCVVGNPPTEFLLGDYSERFLEEPVDLSPLEATLDRWTPDPGAAVHVDRMTIHRRPAAGLLPRLLLVASKRPAEGELDHYALQQKRDLGHG